MTAFTSLPLATGRRPIVRLLCLLGCGQLADALTALTVLTVLVGHEPGVDGRTLLATLMVAALPHVLATPLSAGLVDRRCRVRTMTMVQVVRAAATALVFVAVWSDAAALAWPAAAALLCSQRLVHTLRGAVLPNVAPAHALVPAGAMTLLAGLGFGGVGALAAFALYEQRLAAMSVAVSMHLVAAIGFATWSADLGGGGGGAAPARHRLTPARSLSHTALLLRRDVALTTLHRFLLGASFATLVTWISSAQGTAEGYVTVTGVTSSATVLGIASAPFAVAAVGRRGVELGATAGSAAVMLAAARLDRGVIGVALVSVAFCLFQYQRSATESALQGAVPDAVRGRVLAAYDIVYNVAYLGGAASVLLAGLAATSERAMLVLGGAHALIAAALVGARCLPVRSAWEVAR